MSILTADKSTGSIPKAIESLRSGGTCVVVGLRAFSDCVLITIAPGDFPLNVFDLVFREITVKGSLVGTRQDLRECLEFAERGQISPETTPVSLDGINQSNFILASFMASFGPFAQWSYCRPRRIDHAVTFRKYKQLRLFQRASILFYSSLNISSAT
jgi:hypothetical protein